MQARQIPLAPVLGYRLLTLARMDTIRSFGQVAGEQKIGNSLYARGI